MRMTPTMQRVRAEAIREAKQSALSAQIKNVGDELEFAARVAEGGYLARERHADESDAVRLGYAIASLELAVVLRAMRRGGQPAVEELREARERAIAELGEAPAEGRPEPTGTTGATKRGQSLKRFVVLGASDDDAHVEATYDQKEEAMQHVWKKADSSLTGYVILDCEDGIEIEERYT